MLGRYLATVQRRGLRAANRRAASKLFRMSLRLRREAMEHVVRRRPATVRSLYGVRLHGNWDDSTFRMYVFASYGFVLARLIARRDAPFVFLDIGANQGLYSLLAARNRHCVAVHAFEPVPAVASLLAANLALNRCRGVSLHPVAVSDRCGTVDIVFDPRHSGVSSLATAAGTAATAAQPTRLELVDHHGLDRLIAAEGPPILVKIDVEGHEQTVVSELLRCAFLPRIDTIFYECDETATDVAAIEAMLRARGFGSFVKVGIGTHYDTLAQRRPRD